LALAFEQLEDRSVPATFTVTNLFDSGMGSLRQAIIDANANMGADTIDFASGLTGTITLTSGELSITEELVINGPGASTLIVDGNNSSRIFKIDDFDSVPDFQVTIAGLTLTNGNADSAGGGAILTHEHLTVLDSVISGNTAIGEGGGIYAGGSMFRIILDVANSTVTGNSATASYSGGGGIRVKYGYLTLVNSTVSMNSAPDGGGGIDVGDGSAEIRNSTISQNQATGMNADGGGIVVDFGTLTLENSIVTGNMSQEDGGGISLEYADAIIRGSTITNNSTLGSYGDGGGIAIYDGTLDIENSTISGNSAVDGGGGIDLEFSSATLTNTTLSNNSITGAGGGGGIEASDSTLTVQDSAISGNSAGPNNGGGINLKGGTLNLARSSIIGNSADDGGGINTSTTNSSPSAFIDSSTIANNTAASDGGGLDLGTGTFTILNSTISGNVSLTDEGAGIANSGDLTIVNSTISGNVAVEEEGGGIFNSGSANLTIRNSTITANSAVGMLGDGGGIASSTYATVVLESTIVAGNIATADNDLDGVFNTSLSLIGDPGTATINDLGGTLVGVNPLLGPLANNGGPTLTHALLPGSPAIDSGSNSQGLSFDQRGFGFARVIGAAADIGAYELDCSATLVNGNLFVACASDVDHVITLTSVSGAVNVRIDGADFGNFAVTGQIFVNTAGGDDSIEVDGGIAVPATIESGDGNDTLLGGSGGDTLVGGPGNDVYRFRDNWGADRIVEEPSPGPTDVRRFDGTYVGSYSGVEVDNGNPSPVSGNILASVVNGMITVLDPGSGSGTVSADGMTSFLVSGVVNEIGEVTTFSGSAVVSSGVASASGTWTSTFETGMASGTWSVVRVDDQPGGGFDTIDFSLATVDLTFLFVDAFEIPSDATNFTTFEIDNIERFIGGGGNDEFVFGDGVQLAGGTGELDGGGGSNTLDYSRYTTSVTVNLDAGTATGTGGIDNIQNVVGASASSTVVSGTSDTTAVQSQATGSAAPTRRHSAGGLASDEATDPIIA
jgi:hypothetical protein